MSHRTPTDTQNKAVEWAQTRKSTLRSIPQQPGEVISDLRTAAPVAQKGTFDDAFTPTRRLEH